MRQPFFGSNAKAVLIQTVAGIIIFLVASWLLKEPAYRFSCTYITGSCR